MSIALALAAFSATSGGIRGALPRAHDSDLAIKLDRLEEMLRAGFGRTGYDAAATETSLQDAYHLLGVDESVSEAVLKKTYRRLMSQHHPDKLVSKGLPEQMIKDATEKTQQIKSAYELIKKSRH